MYTYIDIDYRERDDCVYMHIYIYIYYHLVYMSRCLDVYEYVLNMFMHIYIYIYMSVCLDDVYMSLCLLGRGDDTVGNPHKAQFCQFELFELILLLKLNKQLPVEQFEATVSQSTVPSPPPSSIQQLSRDTSARCAT